MTGKPDPRFLGEHGPQRVLQPAQRPMTAQPQAMAQAPAMRPVFAACVGPPQEAEEKLKSIRADVAKVDWEAKQAMQQATTLAGNMGNSHLLSQAEQILLPRSNAMIEVQKKLAKGQRGQQGEVARSFVQLANHLRMTQGNLSNLQNMYRNAKAEQKVKLADAGLRETKALEDLLPEVTQRCLGAEERMEKAVATHEAIAAAGENLDHVQKKPSKWPRKLWERRECS